jgi:hypothetical protein
LQESDIQIDRGVQGSSGPEPESKHRRHHHSHHSGLVCPGCGSHTVSRSHRRGPKEKIVLPLVLLRPFVCHKCRHRFYGFSAGRRTRARLLIVLLTTAVVITLGVGLTVGAVQSAAAGAIRLMVRILTRS